MKFKISNEQDGSSTDYEFNKPEVFIGTSSTNDIVLYQPSLSGRHLKINIGEDAVTVVDLDSRTGTFVNGNRIDGNHVFETDDVIRLGSYDIHLVGASPVGAGRVAKSGRAKSSEWQIETNDEDDAYQESLVPVKQEIHRRLIEFLDLRRMDLKNIEQHELLTTTSRAIWNIMESMEEEISEDIDHNKLHKEMLDEVHGLGPIEDLIKDEDITEIMVNNRSQIFIEMKGKITLTNRAFASNESLLGIIERIVSPLGRRVDESSPMVDARLKDGSRVNAIIPPLSLKGPVLTIRKFSKEPYNTDKLTKLGAVTPDIVEFLEVAIRHRKNIVISGGTSSGKTTLLNALCGFMPKQERIVTIEDSAELQLPQEHLIILESRPSNIQGKGEITIRDLVRNSLRMRPDRIVIGEVRGGEALDMLQAMNTGHDGSMTTGHANAPEDFLRRLETMVLMAGVDLPMRAIREQICSAINIIIQMQRFNDGVRRVINVTEVYPHVDQDAKYSMQDIFTFVQTGIEEGGRVVGQVRPTGAIPRCYEALEATGIKVNKDIFRTE